MDGHARRPLDASEHKKAWWEIADCLMPRPRAGAAAAASGVTASTSACRTRQGYSS